MVIFITLILLTVIIIVIRERRICRRKPLQCRCHVSMHRPPQVGLWFELWWLWSLSWSWWWIRRKKIRRVVTDNKDLGFATSQEELAEMCPKLMDGLRCRHLLLFYQNYKPVSSNTEDSSLRNSQPVQTKSCSQQPSQPPNPLPPNSLKFVFLSCGTIQLKEEVLMCK